MKRHAQSSAKTRGWWLLCCLLLLAMPATRTNASSTQSIVSLDGPWRFHVGDEPGWADAAFDDSQWQTIRLGTPLTEQGIETYSGYAWYRMRLSKEQLAQNGGLPLNVLVTGNTVGQLAAYIGGVEAGHTKGMTEKPKMYESPPFAMQISAANPDGSVTIAIRSWADAEISLGLLGKVQLGSRDEIAEKLELATDRRLDQAALSGLIASFLFLIVAGFGATLYLTQRNHLEYLWLALLCLSVTLQGVSESALSLALIPLSASAFLGGWAAWFFIVATLQFVLAFTGNRHRYWVRGQQIGSIALPIFVMLHIGSAYGYVAVASQIFFCYLIVWMLLGAWRRGQVEAGVMLLPFLLAATADSVDTLLTFAVDHHWIAARFANSRHFLGPIGYSTGTVSYLVFLGSLVAVILYRFVRISQQEQRSSAEIEAARSVQAMLIPTQLPSNRSFLMESAYLPANGVGGDFFQVLPLKDDSMLIVVGDVSGKGLQAAMNASSLVGALRNELSHDPATVLAHLNQVMLGAVGGPSAVAGFATCLCARIYPSGEMVVANAGHLSPYRDGREMELAACLPLGILPNVEYEQSTFHLKQGDRLTFISDGVVEAADTKGELFGFERTQQVSHESARYIAQVAQRFGQTDDITVVSLYFVPA